MRIDIVLDDALLAEAISLTGANTNREVIDLALRELVRRRRKKNLLELDGNITVGQGYNHKATRALRDGLA